MSSLIVILKLWLGGIEQPFEVVMRDADVMRCAVMAEQLSVTVEKKTEFRVRTWECSYMVTKIT